MLDVVVVFLWLAPVYVLVGVASAIITTARAPTPWRGKDFSEVKTWLVSLLRRGYKGGHVLFTHGPSGRSLRFRKYILEQGNYGLELCFPRTEWASEYWPGIEAFCEEAGLRCSVEIEVIDDFSTEVLLIDCARDIDRAYDLAFTIWTKFFDLPISGWFDREADRISVRDELIDDPDHVPLSKQEAMNHRRSKLRDNLRNNVGISIGGVLYVSGLLVLGLIAIVGLPLATLISIGEPPSWSVYAGRLTIGGSATSLIFFVFYTLTWNELHRFCKKMKRPQGTVYERLYAKGLRSIMIVLPIAVILVWVDV